MRFPAFDSSAQGAIAPSRTLSARLGTIRLGSNTISTPRPSHVGHAPCGLLNEKSLGSISSSVKPEIGQANFDEKVIDSLVSAFSTQTRPLLSASAVSNESANRVM